MTKSFFRNYPIARRALFLICALGLIFIHEYFNLKDPLGHLLSKLYTFGVACLFWAGFPEIVEIIFYFLLFPVLAGVLIFDSVSEGTLLTWEGVLLPLLCLVAWSVFLVRVRMKLKSRV